MNRAKKINIYDDCEHSPQPFTCWPLVTWANATFDAAAVADSFCLHSKWNMKDETTNEKNKKNGVADDADGVELDARI